MSSVALVFVCELMTHLSTMPGSTNHVICKREKENISEDAGYRESGENSPTQTGRESRNHSPLLQTAVI